MDPFPYQTLLAPMEGVTHPMFRSLIAERGGLDLLCTEFVRISRADLNPAAIAREVVKHPSVPLSVQVMGNDADKMADAARVVCDAGADIVDINLGCPMPRVVRKGVGAAMLKDPILLDRVLRAMRASTNVLLSAKIRAGFDDAKNVVHIAKVVEGAGADFISVHPRRRADFYEGVSDWRIIRLLKEELSIPVVGNGDVWYAEDALRMRQETSCDGVMIGRGALRNPWIFEQIEALKNERTPVSPDGKMVIAYLRKVYDRYQERIRNPLGKIKEIVRYLGRAVPDDRNYWKSALRESTIEGLLSVTEAQLGGLTTRELDLQYNGHLGLERSGSAINHEAA